VAKELVKVSRSASLLEAHRHRNSHLIAGDSIHGTTDKWRLEEDVSSNATFCGDLLGREIDFARKDEEVVVREAAMKGRIHEVADRQAIRGGVFFELIEGRGWVERHAERMRKIPLRKCAGIMNGAAVTGGYRPIFGNGNGVYYFGIHIRTLVTAPQLPLA
jgi:hypothetical protein